MMIWNPTFSILHSAMPGWSKLAIHLCPTFVGF
jgi:hypothetical protein